MRANALFHVAERRVECREVDLAGPAEGEVLIESRCSAISPGTEAMIFGGAFPKNTALDASIESMKGGFTYPFSYGYALVGEVSAIGPGVDESLIGKTLFAFHPHQDRAVVPLAWRRELAKRWGIAETVDPADAGQWRALLASMNGADLVFELSGDMAALNQAIESSGFDGRIVVGSWYGAKSHSLDLGGRFHRNRLRLISSQVSTLNPALTGRWNKPRRIDLAWRMVAKLQPQRLISQSFSLDQCHQAFETVCARRDRVMQVIFQY